MAPEQIIVLLLLAALVAWFVITRDISKWHPVATVKKVKLMDGRTSTGLHLMGRKVNGKWQYRERTEDELAGTL